MRYLVYKTTNLTNGKIYVGKHAARQIDDGYLGSGVELLRDIKIFGRKNFKRETLFEAKDLEEMNLLEAEIVTPDFLQRKDIYNKVVGGKGGGNISKAREGLLKKQRWVKTKKMRLEHRQRCKEQAAMPTNRRIGIYTQKRRELKLRLKSR